MTQRARGIGSLLGLGAATACLAAWRGGLLLRRLRDSERRLRAARLALGRAEGELRISFDRSGVGKTEVDLSTLRLVRVNGAFCAFLGRTEREVLEGGLHAGFTHPDDRPELRRQWDEMRRTGNAIQTERRFVRSDGAVVWGRLTICCKRWAEDGRPALARTSVQDITRLKEAELALLRSREMLRLSLEIGGVSTFRLDLVSGLIHCDSTARAIQGMPAGDAPVPLRQWLGGLAPEDRHHCLALFRAAAGPGRGAGEIAFEYGLRHGKRGLRTVETRSRIEFDAKGRAVAAVGVVIDVTERRKAENRAEHLAHHDPLTDLPNRSLFRRRLDAVLAQAKTGVGAAVHLVDLDDFKDVNDTLGHPVGDKLLCAVTGRLRALCRGTDTVARLGGDEFAIVQSPVSGQGDAQGLAERVIAALGLPYEIDGQSVEIGTSIGTVMIGEARADGDTLLRNADIALYEAKRAGRGRACLFSPSMEVAIQDRRVLEGELRRAVAGGELEVFYQPLVGIASKRVCGMEALVRWRHKERGMVLPDEFIPLAESNGTIVALGAFVLRTACRDAATWPDEVMIAVNLSASEFNNPGLVEAVADALRQSGLSPGRLQLEITESTVLADTEATSEALRRLRALGVSLSIDDFGTGFSSLSYLQRFAFDKVKIDRSFIAPLGQSAESMVIVRSVIGLCSGLNIETTAEGVETEGQLAILSRIGCTEAQGYHFSRPRPGNEVLEFLRTFAAEEPAGERAVPPMPARAA